MNIVARFYVESVTHVGQSYPYPTGSKSAEKVVLRAVSLATPGASVELYITNQAAWGAFQPGAMIDGSFFPTPKEPTDDA